MEHCVFLLWPDTGEPNQPLIDYLKIHKKAGDKLILWTCRSGVILDKALSWCKEIATLSPVEIGRIVVREMNEQIQRLFQEDNLLEFNFKRRFCFLF